MKELSIEQKARKYDEAIEKARERYNEEYTSTLERSTLAYVFPKLTESEDEKIRKGIIRCVKGNMPDNDFRKKCISWLEKQGKHANFRNKIQIGDKVTRNEDGVLVNLSQLKRVAKKDEKQGEQKLAKQPHSYELEEEIEGWLGCEAFPEGTNITPLPKAMDIVRETANHFYDFGRKQQAIRNIQCTNSQVITPESYINEGQKKGIQMVLDNPQEYGLQKPADKVEPKFKVGDTIAKKHNSDIHDFGSFTITDITGGKYWYNDRIICDISEQDEWEIYEPVRQNSFVWSKEDEEMLNDIIMCGERHCYLDVGNITWLKLLKEKYTWKPSDGQMDALHYVTNFDYGGHKATLVSLYEQLKKLKE